MASKRKTALPKYVPVFVPSPLAQVTAELRDLCLEMTGGTGTKESLGARWKRLRDLHTDLIEHEAVAFAVRSKTGARG